MIEVDNVYKRYRTPHGPGPWVLNGVDFKIPTGVSVGLIGRNGAGKSTLLGLIGGTDRPTKGKIRTTGRISWPMGFGGGLQGSMTGRQNATFVTRIYGREDDLPEILDKVQSFAEIGDNFDKPVKEYSSGMKSRLQFGLSLAFEFDVYISDEVTSVGDIAFRKKAQQAFRDLVGTSTVIMVAHGAKTLREFCEAGIFLDNGKAYWFDDVKDALKTYNKSLGL